MYNTYKKHDGVIKKIESNCYNIKVQGLEKYFEVDRTLLGQLFMPFAAKQKICALREVSFNIEAGEILGVIGPNGAGKTTLLRILADILEADNGTVSISGQMLNKNNFRIRNSIGYVSSDERSFFWRLTGRENLEFFARLYGLSASKAKRRTAVLIDQFGFENKADQLFRDYSAGTRKKVSVMRALLHKPSLLLLDEVTNSLDSGSAEKVKQTVRRYVSGRKDSCAIWSTHRLEEVSQICDRVVMLDSGKIVSSGLTEDFTKKSSYVLKVKNLNGQIDELCKKIGFSTKVQLAKDNVKEILISGIDSSQFSRIVSMAVKDFGAYIIFAGCIKKDTNEIFEDFQTGERLYGNNC